MAKQITVQEGFVYQQANAPGDEHGGRPSPPLPIQTRSKSGLIAGEGDTGLTGDTFAVCGIDATVNITHPVTGQTNNFFVSYAQGATDPNWTSNFSTDNVSWILAPGHRACRATPA